MAKVGRMNVVVTAGTSGLTRGLRASESAIDRFVGRAGKASSVIGGKFRGGLNSAAGSIAAFGAAATAGAVAAGIAIKAGADRIDDLADSSKRLLGNNGATGALAGLRYAAEEAGVEAGILDKGLEKLLDNISKANRGDKGAIEAFRAIGLDAKNLAAMRPEQRMIAVADALGKVKDAGDKIAFSKGIFGKAGAGLIPLFNEGGDAIRATTRDLEFFGQSISALNAEKVGTMNDNLGRMQLAWEGVTMQLAVHFAPLVSDLSDRLIGMINDAGGVGSAVDKAFGASVEYTGDFLDAVEGLNIGWLKFKRTVTGVGVILADISKVVTKPIEKVAEWMNGDETAKRLEMIAPDKREEFKRLLEQSGGFQNENVDIRAGLADENADIRKQIADAESQRREKGSLGDRFKAWERGAQAKGATNAAAKLTDASEKRLDAEEAITDEAEKQTKEKKNQLRLESAGEGKFALMAFNGITGSSVTKKDGKTSEEAKAATKERGVVAMAKAASSEEEPYMPALESKTFAASSAREQATTTMPAAAQGKPEFGSKEYFDGVLGLGKNYTGATNSASTEGENITPTMHEWRRSHPDWGTKKVPAKPTMLKDWKAEREAKREAERPDWEKYIPTGEPSYADKMGPRMEAAMGGDPVSKALQGRDTEKQDKMIALLEKIAGNTKSPTLGLV